MATCEAVFETKKVVKDIDRYYHLGAALPSNITRKLLDVLTYKGEEGDRLVLLKSRLMELFVPSEGELYTRMCGVPMLQPGQKPSALYANLRALLPHDVEPDVDSTYLFRMMFLTRLPKNIQSLVQAQGKKPVSEMAAFANYVVLNEGKPSLPIQAASFNWAEEVEGQEQLAARDNTTVGQAVNVVNQTVKGKVKALKKFSGMCFYHTKFGSKAEKCEGKGCYLSPPQQLKKLGN